MLVFVPLTGTPCSDHDDCTRDICDNGVCEGTVGASRRTEGRVHDDVTLAWDAATEAYYDVARGSLSEMPPGSGTAGSCIVNDTYLNYATDAQLPSSGSGFWYLVRSHNSCDPGTYGHASDGTPHTLTTCP
jgi:hypothetical protein